jgi:hypothetical protein
MLIKQNLEKYLALFSLVGTVVNNNRVGFNIKINQNDAREDSIEYLAEMLNF